MLILCISIERNCSFFHFIPLKISLTKLIWILDLQTSDLFLEMKNVGGYKMEKIKFSNKKGELLSWIYCVK